MFPPKAGFNNKGKKTHLSFADLLKLNEQLRVSAAK